jgi:DNA-binding transcriptional LysR family regulator
VAAPLSFGVGTLAPHLCAFHAEYPGLRVSVDLDDRMVNPLENGADVTLRIGPLEDSSLVARRLRDYRRIVCAAPAYLSRRGIPGHPGELAAHDCLHYSNIALKDEWSFGDAGGQGAAARVEVSGPLCANNGDLLRKAAVAGLGICALPEFIVAPDIEAGRLRSILSDYPAPRLTLWALWPSRRYVPAKVRVFVAFLSSALGSDG